MTSDEVYERVIEKLNEGDVLAIYLGLNNFYAFMINAKVRHNTMYYPGEAFPRFYGIPVYKVTIADHCEVRYASTSA